MRYPLRFHIATAIGVLVLFVGCSITWIAFQRQSAMLAIFADRQNEIATKSISDAIEEILGPVSQVVTLLASDQTTDIEGPLSARLKNLPVYIGALKTSPAAVAIYLADTSGNYFLVRRIAGQADQALFSAPEATRFIVQNIVHGKDSTSSENVFFDEHLNEVGRLPSTQYLEFDPKKRPWYLAAKESKDQILTTPYIFFSSGKRGLSIAMQSEDRLRVAGADIRLDSLIDRLGHLRVTRSTRLALRDQDGELLAEDIPDPQAAPTPPAIAAALDALRSGNSTGFRIRQRLEQKTWHLTRMQIPSDRPRSIFLEIAIPENELLAGAVELRNQLLVVSGAFLILALAIGIWLARRISLPLGRLLETSKAMKNLDFSTPVQARSMILEVDELADTLGQAQSTLGSFLDILRHLNHEKDFRRLLPELLEVTIDVSQVGGGFMLLTEGSHLKVAAGRWGGENVAVDHEVPVSDKSFALKSTLDALKSIAGKNPKAAADDELPTPARYFLSVPLSNRDKKAIGVLVLLSHSPIEASRRAFIEALSGFAAVALETRELIATQKALFSSFIKVMATAIDAKSPYTGGHCARVPELAHLLARAACQQTEGPYADFALTEDEWEALYIASWLHDCGKVTTPEYVVDKATKLETIYDRIHEIRMRFEVLKRDAEIACYQRMLAGVAEDAARRERDALLATLDEEFAFVASCNEGGEFMDSGRIDKLARIASRSWKRTLDDRLGVSTNERLRKEQTATADLPVDEPLLSDKPEHRIAHQTADTFSYPSRWGFSMRIPPLQYDRGELKNLSIARGTLADEERYKINEHIIHTIIMLGALPFPNHLKNVPEIAGGHHERMDGKGYPRGLHGKDMSPLARIMAIADVFEALTASDRPYKKAKSLREALSIMERMVEEGHIDEELFRIFVNSGCPVEYARQHLLPTQLDIVAPGC